jgi:hypothetical protein
MFRKFTPGPRLVVVPFPEKFAHVSKSGPLVSYWRRLPGILAPKIAAKHAAGHERI